MNWRWLDYMVVAGYLVFTGILGLKFSKSNKTTDDYFVGSSHLPGWAVGLSLLSTTMSSVTFLAYPATSYLIDWRLLTKDFWYPAVALFTAALVAPRFRAELQSPSAYEFLEQRFSLTARLYAAAVYAVSQLLKLCTVLYLVSIPVSLLLGAPQDLVIIGSGVFVTCYSLAGGISAVVYTDALQAVILLMGGIASVLAIVLQVPGNFGMVSSEGHRHDKFSLGSPHWSWQRRTVPTIAAYSGVHYLIKFVSYQDAVQRYLSVPSTKELYKAIAVTGTLAVPMWALFYFIGTCLWAYYRACPSPEVAGMLPDAVFPHFIMTQLPPGVAGMVISGVVAAAMSTLDSSLNATSSVITLDFVKRAILPGRSDSFYLATARGVSVVASVLMIGTALLLKYLPMESLNDLHNSMQSQLAGAVVSMFLLGLFAPWFGNAAVLAALAGSTLLNSVLVLGNVQWLPERPALCGFLRELHPYWAAPIVNLAFCVMALGAELGMRVANGKSLLAVVERGGPYEAVKATDSLHRPSDQPRNGTGPFENQHHVLSSKSTADAQDMELIPLRQEDALAAANQ